MAIGTTTRSDTRSKIVDVAARLLREQGPAAVTTRRVADGAGVQAPTIYRLFGDKDGLLEAVAEHVMATFVSSKAAKVEAAAVDGVDPVADLRESWRAQIEFGLANPTLFGFLSDPRRVRQSPAAQSGQAILEARVHRIALAGRLAVPEPRAVAMIRAAGTGVISTLLSMPPEARDPGLADAMTDAVLAQILTDEPPAGEHGPLATAVAFRAIAPDLQALTGPERSLLTEWIDRAIDGL
jgi:AcrR family transcriptional regulator